ncbi:MAG TPA: hypothetical protein VFP87_06340 [Chitinophagaceae bacterium]|nr:hypothetical protein [Chitinophagaceae bacterium]
MIQRIWAALIGFVSTIIGVLKFLSVVNIPAMDAWVHVITGLGFIAGAFVQQGRFVKITNLCLGALYVIFGIAGGFNLPHIIAGIISIAVGLIFKSMKLV